MTSPLSAPLLRRASLLAAAIFLAAGVSNAQSSTSSQADSQAAGVASQAAGSDSYSSSQTGLSQTELAEFAAPAFSSGSSMSSGAGAAGQYGSGGGHGYHAMFHHWTYEVGGGFNAPLNDNTADLGGSSNVPSVTWGANFTLGGGLRFNKYLSLLAEYQFIDDKLPATLVAAENNALADLCSQDPSSNACGVNVTTGNTHVNSITASPVFDLTPKRSSGIYLVGGGGWYHKSTNFQEPQIVFSYYGEYAENVTQNSFTSNQWGANGGLGLYHRFSNVYGDTNHTELFAEARYLYIHTPPNSQENGLGITQLIPVTIGFRF